MSMTSGLLALGVRYAFDLPADQVLAVIEKRLSDHSQTLPRALAKANDRAWQAVGLALAGDSLFGWVKDWFRDADMKGARDQLKAFLDQTPTGLERAPAAARAKAAEEWGRLRKAGRFAAAGLAPAVLARRAASMERHADLARVADAARAAVREAAEGVRADAPHLADLLTAAPEGGTPLLAAAFAFFFRREVETDDELARGLSFDYLRRLSERQERGLALLDARTSGFLDQIAALFDALGDWFAAQGDKLDDINAKLDRLVALRDVPTSASGPLKVSVTNQGELQLLHALRDRLRHLPPEVVAAADWAKLGDTLAAAGAFGESGEAHAAAAAAARAGADPGAEAEAHYKQFRVACEAGEGAAAMAAFLRAVELAPARFAPFDLHRYAPAGVLGAGGFGTVFLAHDQYVRGPDRRPQEVAIKAMHDSGLDALLDRDPAQTFDEADTLSALNHPSIVKTLNRGFGDPAGRKRPYLVMERFRGMTLDAWLSANGPPPLRDVLAIAQLVADALHAAHRRGILHRDLKPGNVMVARDAPATDAPATDAPAAAGGAGWRVKVIDFGLAVKLDVARHSIAVPAGRRTALDRSLAGTLRYAPPEQHHELDAPVGPYSDVYAWGKTCLDLLFRTTEPKSIHWRTLPADCRERVQDLLDRATVGELEHRFRDFEPVLSALAELVGGPGPEPAPGEPAPATDPDPRPAADGAVMLVVNDHYNITRNLNAWLTEAMCRSPAVDLQCVDFPGAPTFRFVPFEAGPAYGMKLAADANRAAWGQITAVASNRHRLSLRVLVAAAPAAALLLGEVPAAAPAPVPPPAPPSARAPVVETPLQKLKRTKGEVAAKTARARDLLGRYEYEAAARVLEEFTPEQAEFRDAALLGEAADKRDRLRALDGQIRGLLDAHRFLDPRLPVWVGRYLELKPDDGEMRELAGELPPLNDPPADPKAGEPFTLRVAIPEPDPPLTVALEWGTVPPLPGVTLRWEAASLPPPVELAWEPASLPPPVVLQWPPVPPRPNPNPPANR